MSYSERLYQTLLNLLALPSTSGHEEQVRDYLQAYVTRYGLFTELDSAGNLIATLPGSGPSLLLNAHMDRVPPGLGHTPILRDGILYSDGTTNLGADDAAGLVIILEVVRRVLEQNLPHPPLVLVFTVQEESGLCGANGFNSERYNVHDGLVFDNAFAPGVVVSRSAAYEAFDITIKGRTGHPGKDLSTTVHAIDIFRAAQYPHGSLANDQTRINIGRISAGNARNAIPDTVHIEGELRSFESEAQRSDYRKKIEQGFVHAAEAAGGTAEVKFTTHSTGYHISPGEPLLQTYQKVLAERGAILELQPTFIGSDTSGFRPNSRAFTVSTGVLNEHSVEEQVALAPLEQIVQDALSLLEHWSQHRE